PATQAPPTSNSPGTAAPPPATNSAPAAPSSGAPPAATPPAPAAKPAATPKPAAPPLSPALLHAQQLFRTGKFDSAIAEYNSIIAANGPEGANAYAGLAHVYLKQKKPADALPAAQKAVALAPDLAAAHTAL